MMYVTMFVPPLLAIYAGLCEIALFEVDKHFPQVERDVRAPPNLRHNCWWQLFTAIALNYHNSPSRPIYSTRNHSPDDMSLFKVICAESTNPHAVL